MTQHYQIAILGAGPGGYVAALRAAALGAKVAVVEKHHLGGTCLNYGCIPSKALLSSAELLHQIQHAGQWGLAVPGPARVDWPAVQKNKDKVLAKLRGGIANFFKVRGVTQLAGTASLAGPGKVVVSGDKAPAQTLTADHVLIATGSAPTRLPGWPDDPRIICTSDEAVHWPDLPKHLLIVGGGVIGCEFACMMNALGVQVTVVEMLPGLLPTLDADLGAALRTIFEKRGIACFTDTKVNEVKLAGDVVTAALSNGKTLAVDRVLVSVGRSPNTRGLGLETTGVQLTKRGFVPVDDALRTSVKGLWAIGDVNGKCLLAHAASAHGVAAVENALHRPEQPRPFLAPIPSAVYTFPEIGSVGLTEKECREQNLPYAVGRFPIGYLGKAMAGGHTDGFVKTLKHRESGAILGVHILGHNATEYIAAAGAMLHQKATMHDLADVVFAHPTLSEAIKESAEDALALGLHLPPRKIIRVAV